MGVIECFSQALRPPEEDVYAMLAALGNQFGQFLERKQVDQTLRQAEARTRAILDAALDAIISIDHHGVIQEFNPAAEQMFGYRRAEVLHRELAEVMIPPALRERHWQGLAHYLATGEGPVLSQRIEVPAMRADGTEFPVELAITRIATDGPPMFTGYIRDITERQRAEEERAELLAREQAARVELERALRARDDFLSIAAHELKSPVTALRGHTQLLQRRVARDQALDERYQRSLQVMDEQAERLTRMMDQMLDISRIAAGQFTLDLAPLDLCGLVRRLGEQIQLMLEQHSLRLECEAEWLMVVGDELRLEQVVQNLLHNAIKYSPQGGLVTVRLMQQEDSAVIMVQDQGIGIPAAAQARLFERFYRASNVDGLPIVGMGIGLYVVHEIVQRHGGRVEVTSSEGEGSTFRVLLPLAQPTPTTPRE